MPNPFVQTSTTTGAKTPCLVDNQQSPFNLSVGVILNAGATATYGVEFTMDDVNNPAITPVWLPDANLPAGQAANGVTNYMFPVMGIRVNIAAVTGAGLRFIVLQGTQQL